MTKMIVIGAGVMGASAAFRLAQAGADVTVIDATRIGGGTSGTSFAWINAHKAAKVVSRPQCRRHESARCAEGRVRRHPWWHGGGSLEWNSNLTRPSNGRMSSSCEPGYAAEWIDLKQVQELEPDINPAVIGEAPVAYFPEEGWLDPVVYAHAMLSTAQRRHGTKIVCGAKVVDLLMTGERVSGVRLADEHAI
jgi:glycine/D-amino acid oxidase-like deaminating enzyme